MAGWSTHCRRPEKLTIVHLFILALSDSLYYPYIRKNGASPSGKAPLHHNHIILAEHVLTKYSYPDETFYLRSYMFTIVCGKKVYTITYAADPQYFFSMYDKKFINSISSFVDETGWY